MKKLLLSLVAVLTMAILCNDIYAQNSSKSIRKERRQQANEQADNELTAAVEARNVRYIATEIVYGQSPALQNIQLFQLYQLWIAPDYLKVFLPIYGPNNFNGQPSLMNRLDFSVNKYFYSYKALEKGGYEITVKATDPWSVNEYTFFITTNADGNWSSMSVQTNFSGPVDYSGSLRVGGSDS